MYISVKVFSTLEQFCGSHMNLGNISYRFEISLIMWEINYVTVKGHQQKQIKVQHNLILNLHHHETPPLHHYQLCSSIALCWSFLHLYHLGGVGHCWQLRLMRNTVFHY